jgi:hypothetical protein
VPAITLKYVNSGVTYSRAFSALLVKGFKPGDGHVVFPAQYTVHLNGNLRKKQAGFRRVFDIDLGVLTSDDDLTAAAEWLASENQYLTFTYGSTTETDLRVVDRHPDYESEWLNNVEIGRRVVIRCEEAAIRSTYPSGSSPTPPTETMYFKKGVAITGTPSSPQTLTFGSGALAATESAGAFPTVNGAIQVYAIEVEGEQDAHCYKVKGSESINGSGYVTFTAAHSQGGNAHTDDAFYATIKLTVQTI